MRDKSRRRFVVGGALTAIVLCLFVLEQALAADSQIHRVVMHLNSDDDNVQKGLLGNIRNLYEAMGTDHVKVELVAHGAGLNLLVKKESRFAEELARLKKIYGIDYTACSNTMKAMKLTREDLVDQVDRTVPAIVRLVELQEQGWAYITP